MSVASDAIRRWRDHPAQMVKELFGVTPDAWQEDVLEAFPHKQRQALKACKGPGKTAVEAWLGWNFLLTRPHPKVAATSITADNLADNLWTEMAVWRNKSPLLQATFTWTKTRIFANDHPETWWMSARPWSKSANKEEQGNTLAGLHADYIFFILDESGGIPDSVMVSADAALSSCIEGHILQAGNPTHLEGPLYKACTTERRLWDVTEITGDPDDPKRSPRINLKWANDMIERYGRDHPYVLVNLLGKFPPSSLNALIGPDEVADAMKRDYKAHDFKDSARILGVDCALFGDDASVIFPRQGLQSFNPLVFRNIDGTQGANHVARKWKEWGADACFVDNTGGFGSSWCDNLRRLGYNPVGVHFSEKPVDGKYFNKRAEMMFECVQWIREGGALPPNRPELLASLTQTTYTFKGDKMMIEPKEVIKEKLGYSPDEMDALILTWATPVIKANTQPTSSTYSHQTSYAPLSVRHVRESVKGSPTHQTDWKPSKGR